MESLRANASLVDPDLRIPLADAARMLDEAIELTQDPAIGLHAAAFFEPNDRDLLEAAARSCATLQAALECTIRYIRLISDEACYSLEYAVDQARFCRHSTARGTVLRVTSDFAMLDMVQFLRRNATVDESEYAVEFAHSEPGYADEYHRIFRCQVRFDARHTALVFNRAQLVSPMKARCPVLAESFAHRAEGQLSRLAEETTVACRVRKFVTEHLSSGQVTMEWAARSLGLSPPTLRRHLESEHTTFSSILEQVRREVAERELRGRRSVSEIAFSLGFSSASAFDRAFRRWYAMLPTEYREGIPGGRA